MQAASSAKRTCSESRSTSLWTATVLMPISLHVQMMRQAISPRLATRIFLNLRGSKAIKQESGEQVTALRKNAERLLTSNTEQRLPVLHRLAVLNINLHDFSAR